MVKELLNKSDYLLEIKNAGNKPILIDLYATWCGPCMMQAPIVDEVAEELLGQAIVLKANVDEYEEIAIENKVMSIPTLLIIKEGEVKEKIIGLTEKQTLIEKIKKYI